MTLQQVTRSPFDGSVVDRRALATAQDIDQVLHLARKVQVAWSGVPLRDRIAQVTCFVDEVMRNKQMLAFELSQQMGRPVRYAPGELAGFEERARHMIAIAPEALADIVPPKQAGCERFVQRMALGVVFVLAPWNYPYLTAVNSFLPALVAGNVVVLKHSDQTPLVAERLVEAAEQAGLPDGVFQALHLNHSQVAQIIASDRVDFVAFTGSVSGGHAVQQAASGRFAGVGLELGGKDPAYVRADAQLEQAVEAVVDGAFFNSGQSCCGIERAYVADSLYDAFIDKARALVEAYVVGDPADEKTTLGPLARNAGAVAVRRQVDAAIAAGACGLIDAARFELTRFSRGRDDSKDGVVEGSNFVAPQLLIDVDHSMDVMREETFGPVLGVMRVSDDEHAIELMNDSRYGLTAAVFSSDLGAVRAIGKRLSTGTVFMNRCDYLDPALAWVGVKDSGRGCTLSRVGYEQLTRPKSFHLRYDLEASTARPI